MLDRMKSDEATQGVVMTAYFICILTVTVYFIRRFQNLVKYRNLLDCLCRLLLIIVPSLWNNDDILLSITFFVIFDMWMGFVVSGDIVYLFMMVIYWGHNYICVDYNIELRCTIIGLLLAFLFMPLFSFWSSHIYPSLYPEDSAPTFSEFSIRFTEIPSWLMNPVRSLVIEHDSEDTLKHVLSHLAKSCLAIFSRYVTSVSINDESLDNRFQNTMNVGYMNNQLQRDYHNDSTFNNQYHVYDVQMQHNHVHNNIIIYNNRIGRTNTIIPQPIRPLIHQNNNNHMNGPILVPVRRTISSVPANVVGLHI